MKYISLEEALQAIKDSEFGKEYESVEAVPAFDLVTCRDCKHASRCYGALLMASRGGGFIHQPLDYCSYGERKERSMNE